MIKQALLLLISVTLIQSSYAQSPNITVEAPTKVSPGQTFPIKINIDKGSIVGFSMVKQNVPMGSAAKLIDAQNASFSVQENKVKFIWIAVPQQEKISISYEVTLPDTLSSGFELKGLFYYLVDGKRTKVPVTPYKIELEGGPSLADNSKEAELTKSQEEKTKAEEEEKIKAENEEKAQKEAELAKAEEEKTKAEEEEKIKAEDEEKAQKEAELAKAEEEKTKAEEEEKIKAEDEEKAQKEAELAKAEEGTSKTDEEKEIIEKAKLKEKVAKLYEEKTAERNVLLNNLAISHKVEATHLGQFNRLEDIAQKSQDEIYVPTEANVKAISNTQYLVRADTETIKSIAENYRISPEVLKRFNPGLKDDVAKGNILMIPNSDQIKADGHLILEISQKDDFAKMADSYGISKAELIQFNPALANGVNQGDNILIPSNDELSSSDKGFAHNSEEGDNWYLVAEKYGISVEDLKRFNPNFDDELVADQLVFIPSKELLSKSSNQTYVTKKGDTFEGIKEIYHVSQEELIAFNPNNIDELEEGTNLLIPSSSQIKTTGTLWQTNKTSPSFTVSPIVGLKFLRS